MRKNRILAGMLVAIMVLGSSVLHESFGMSAFGLGVLSASAAETAGSGTCGENLTWVFDDGTLTISGTGKMEDYGVNEPAPWYGYEITSVVIKNGVTGIGDRAFLCCSSLTSIELPNSITSIGYYAFERCSSLESIELPDSITRIGEFSFACSSLKSIELPDSITSIGYYAFWSCSGLTSIELPDSITSIEHFAFEGCTSLTSIELPNSVTSIGECAFMGCSSLTSIELPDSITSIGAFAFSGCSLTSIELPASIVSSGTCGKNLAWVYDNRELTISGTGEMEEYVSGDDVPWYGYWITSVVIENGITSIGDDAFFACIDLTSIELPASITSIGDGAFRWCGLTSIELPDSITSIGGYAFGWCAGLTSIKLPASITSIEGGTFYECCSLTSIELPASVTRIGEGAFSSCSNLSDVYYSGSEEGWGKISMGSDNESLTSATIHYNSTVDADATTDKSSDLFDFIKRIRLVSEMNYLCLSTNFPNTSYVNDNYGSAGSLAVMLLTNSIYRGIDGWKNLLTAETSVESAEKILAALLEEYQSECEELTTAKSAKKYAQIFVTGLNDYISGSAIAYSSCSEEDFQKLVEAISVEKVENYLIDGKFSELTKYFQKECGYSSNSEIVKVLNDYMKSETLAKNLSDGLSFLGSGLEILSLTQDTINYLFQLEALLDADEMYSEMLLYLKENASNSIVREAAGNLYSVIHGAYWEQLNYVTTALQNKVAETAFDKLLDVALSELPYVVIIKKGFDFGVSLSNLIFHTSDIQELKDNMWIITEIGYGLSPWVLENYTAYLRAYYESGDEYEEIKYANRTYYSLYMLWLVRKAGEENLQSMLKTLNCEFSKCYILSLQTSNLLEAQKETCFSEQNIARLAALTTREANSIELPMDNIAQMISVAVACPVDVEIYDKDGVLVARVYDGEEASGWIGDLRYDVVYNVLDDDYVKIISFPENCGYTFNYIGLDAGLVDSYIMTISDTGETKVQYFENLEVSANDVIEVKEIASGEYGYVVTKAVSGEVSTGVFETAGEYIEVNNITLSESQVVLKVEEKKQLTFTVSPDEAITKKVIWQSSNENVAKVNSDGVVTAVAAGVAVITATAVGGDATATCTVNVTGTTVIIGDVTQQSAVVSDATPTGQNSGIAVYLAAAVLLVGLVGAGVVLLVTGDGQKSLSAADEAMAPVFAAKEEKQEKKRKECSHLLQITGGSMNGYRFPIKSGETIYIGKDVNAASIVLSREYEKISRLHCSITFDAKTDQYYVVDCSTNGTYLKNQERLVKGKRTAVAVGSVLALAGDECFLALK